MTRRRCPRCSNRCDDAFRPRAGSARSDRQHRRTAPSAGRRGGFGCAAMFDLRVLAGGYRIAGGETTGVVPTRPDGPLPLPLPVPRLRQGSRFDGA